MAKVAIIISRQAVLRLYPGRLRAIGLDFFDPEGIRRYDSDDRRDVTSLTTVTVWGIPLERRTYSFRGSLPLRGEVRFISAFRQESERNTNNDPDELYLRPKVWTTVVVYQDEYEMVWSWSRGHLNVPVPFVGVERD